MGLLTKTCEGFVNGMVSGNASDRKQAYVDFLAAVLAYIVALVILSFIGLLLWNNVVVDLFSFAKSARSIWQILGLMIFVSLMNP